MSDSVRPSQRNSRIPGFYDQERAERAQRIAELADLGAAELAALDGTGGLSAEQANHMIENVIGLHALPLGVAVNFLINGRDTLIPMALEEPSVVAGASFMAKLARAAGGFTAHMSEPLMIGQMQILSVPEINSARLALLENKARILELANAIDPVLIRLGGGARDLEVRVFEDTPIGPFLVAHLIYDTRDAMGANSLRPSKR
jgi:hydroxymethylglutaryl-CoA reductase